VHLPVAVHRHPRARDHPDHDQPDLSGQASPAGAPAPAAPGSDARRGSARNLDRGTVLASDLETGSSLFAKFMGLMGRRSLPAGAGLWLPASNGIHMMFMRFPIDAVFVGKRSADGSRAVKSVHRGLRRWIGLVPLVLGADGVLELPVGTIEASGTRVGDRLEILEA
jgi:uncharacterized membrane protein (UPF0127 family)